jgi:hypothetical protein
MVRVTLLQGGMLLVMSPEDDPGEAKGETRNKISPYHFDVPRRLEGKLRDNFMPLLKSWCNLLIT